MIEPSTRSPIRLAELLAVLSLGTDLGMGQPMEHVMRECLIALRLAERVGLSETERAVAYYVALLAWVGCHVDSYEQAKWFGDEFALKGDFRLTNITGTASGMAYMMRHLGAGKPLAERVRLGVAFLGEGRRNAEDMLENHWLAADGFASQLGLGGDVRHGIQQTFERWDGKGVPHGARGEEISMVARIVNLADVVEVYHRAGGVEAAVAVARERAGIQFDPALVDTFCAEAPMLFSDLEAATTWEAVIGAEPALQISLSEEEFDSALEAMADFTDLKSPYTMGHSRAVADLAGGAARTYGLPDAEATSVRRAGLVHDLGRLGVSNAIWDKRGELTPAEQERVRLHPYLSERMLASSSALAPLGAICIQHHERLDGSGYPRGLSGDALTPAGRVLAAADAYAARREPRPHRPERSEEEAAADLRDLVRTGRLDGDAVDAVLRAAGHRVGRRRDRPAGLTSREVDVLRLVALGLSTREIAERLVISPKTAGNHVEHIYAKIGVSNRARASLFAAKHGLMAADPVIDEAR